MRDTRPYPQREPEPDYYPELRERPREPEPDYYPELRERHREPEPEYYPEPRERYRERERPRSRRDPYDEDDRRGFQGPSADAIGRTIQIVTALIALSFVLHIIFVVTGANQSNDFVSFAYSVAKVFVFGLGDVFTPEDATIGVVLNYSLAAFIYLVLGRIIARALRR